MFRRPLKPTDSLNIPIRIFKMFGFWHLGGKYQPLYFIYGKFIYLFIIVCYASCQLISVFIDGGNLHEMVDGIYLSLTIVCLTFKVGLLNTKKMMAVISFQNCEIFTSQQTDQDCYIVDAMKATKRNAIGILSLGSVICTLWNVGPLLNGTFKQKILPFKAWYPVPQTVSPYYEIVYAYQYFGILFCAWINLSSDALMAGLMTLTCGQLQVLKHSLRNIRNNAIASLKEYPGYKICKTCDNNEEFIWKCADPVHLTQNDNILEGKICEELQNCITHHSAILQFIRNYEDTFSASMFSQFAASLIIICITAYKISIITPFTTQFIAILLYMLNVISQILFYCWYGNEIFLTSLTFNNDIYVSDWYRCGPRVKKIILIMMERCKRPMILRAGKLFTLSLDTFTTILRKTYSFYAVLQQMDIDIDEVNEAAPIEEILN